MWQKSEATQKLRKYDLNQINLTGFRTFWIFQERRRQRDRNSPLSSLLSCGLLTVLSPQQHLHYSGRPADGRTSRGPLSSPWPPKFRPLRRENIIQGWSKIWTRGCVIAPLLLLVICQL